MEDAVDSNQPPQPKRMSRHQILSLITLILLIAGITVRLYTWRSRETATSPLSAIIPAATTASPTPTPMLFKELTVPYLRERTYTSRLDELNQEYANEDYTAYTTSYESDGLRINGLITRPAGDKPEGGWPAIVFIHGYLPPTTYETLGQPYSAYVDYLARQGFVVFKIDLRGHGTSQGEPGGAYYSSDYSIDALHAYAALQKSDFVNPSRIGFWGHSMAGNVLLRTLASKPDIPAIVIWGGAGYSYEDLQKYGIDDNSYRPPANDSKRQERRKLLFDTYGQFSTDSEFWKQVAPTNYLSDVTGAIELHHAVDDAVVNTGYSRDLNAILDKTSIEHSLYEYPSGGHNISGASFNTAMKRTADFFQKHLQ